MEEKYAFFHTLLQETVFAPVASLITPFSYHFSSPLTAALSLQPF